jgi:hypothetical protein
LSSAATLRTKRNFLSELIADDGVRRPRRPTKLKCTIYYCKKGLREFTAQRAVVGDLSQSGCKIFCPVPDAVDNNIYLVIDGVPAKFPCSVARRAEGEIGVRFYEEIPKEIVAKLTTPRF